jgi:GNAT superfamily N-acetyltransferase
MDSLISQYIHGKGEYSDIPKTSTTLSIKDKDTQREISSIVFDKTDYGYHIILLITDEKYRNKGYAKYLVNTILSKRQSDEFVTCNVLFYETYNLKFWDKCGFNGSRIIDGYIQLKSK